MLNKKKRRLSVIVDSDDESSTLESNKNSNSSDGSIIEVSDSSSENLLCESLGSTDDLTEILCTRIAFKAQLLRMEDRMLLTLKRAERLLRMHCWCRGDGRTDVVTHDWTSNCDEKDAVLVACHSLSYEDKLHEICQSHGTYELDVSRSDRFLEIICSQHVLRAYRSARDSSPRQWMEGVSSLLSHATSMRVVEQGNDANIPSISPNEHQCDLCGRYEHCCNVALDLAGPVLEQREPLANLDQMVSSFYYDFLSSYNEFTSLDLKDAMQPNDSLDGIDFGRIRLGKTCVRSAISTFRLASDFHTWLFNTYQIITQESNWTNFALATTPCATYMTKQLNELKYEILNNTHSLKNLPVLYTHTEFWERLDTLRTTSGDVLEETFRTKFHAKRVEKTECIDMTDTDQSSQDVGTEDEDDVEDEDFDDNGSEREKPSHKPISPENVSKLTPIRRSTRIRRPTVSFVPGEEVYIQPLVKQHKSRASTSHYAKCASKSSPQQSSRIELKSKTMDVTVPVNDEENTSLCKPCESQNPETLLRSGTDSLSDSIGMDMDRRQHMKRVAELNLKLMRQFRSNEDVSVKGSLFKEIQEVIGNVLLLDCGSTVSETNPND